MSNDKPSQGDRDERHLVMIDENQLAGLRNEVCDLRRQLHASQQAVAQAKATYDALHKTYAGTLGEAMNLAGENERLHDQFAQAKEGFRQLIALETAEWQSLSQRAMDEGDYKYAGRCNVAIAALNQLAARANLPAELARQGGAAKKDEGGKENPDG